MSILILPLAVLIPSVFVLACLLVWRFWRRLDKRRSPLTVQLRNLPGEQLRKRIASHEDAFDETAMAAISLGPVLLATWLIGSMKRVGVELSQLRFGSDAVLLVILGLVVIVLCVWRLIHHARKRRKYADGLQAELAVAQCLTPLIADGAMVFHDFPADKYNIDHIVIGRSVVFAIETKSRRKPPQKGQDSARVQYDGQQLMFPRHSETKPVQQAAYQADWLEKFLRSGVGEDVRVVPVLALPGWYVESVNRAGRQPVLVSNCHNPAFMMSDKFGPPMSETLRRRIAHVLTERYPPLEF